MFFFFFKSRLLVYSVQDKNEIPGDSKQCFFPRLEFIYNQLCISLQLHSQRWSTVIPWQCKINADKVNADFISKITEVVTKSEKASEKWIFEIVSVWNLLPEVKTVPAESFVCQSRRLMVFCDVLAALADLMQTPGHAGAHLCHLSPCLLQPHCSANANTSSTWCLGFALDPNKADLHKSDARSYSCSHCPLSPAFRHIYQDSALNSYLFVIWTLCWEECVCAASSNLDFHASAVPKRPEKWRNLNWVLNVQ